MLATVNGLQLFPRYGLVKGSFIPEKELRDLRLLTRYCTKLKGTIASEVNRMHKVLSDGGRYYFKFSI